MRALTLSLLIGLACATPTLAAADIREERVRTCGRFVLPRDVVPKCLLSSSSFRSAAPCAMAGSAVDDGPCLALAIPPEPCA